MQKAIRIGIAHRNARRHLFDLIVAYSAEIEKHGMPSLLEGWKWAQKMPASIAVSDPNMELLGKLKALAPSITTAGENKAAVKDIIFLAVYPPALPDAVAQMKGILTPEAIVVCLAPK